MCVYFSKKRNCNEEFTLGKSFYYTPESLHVLEKLAIYQAAQPQKKLFEVAFFPFKNDTALLVLLERSP